MYNRHNTSHVILVLGLLASIFTVGCQSDSSATSTTSQPVNLLANPDFNQGAEGFISDYTYNRDLFDAGTYVVGRSPATHHRFARDFGDHTSGMGLMLLANGSTEPNQMIWSQTVKVKYDTQYELSGWVAAWGNTLRNPPKLVFVINGEKMKDIYHLEPAQAGEWKRFRVIWNSRSSRTAKIEIIDVVTEAMGNDIALDDLSFKEVR